MRTIYAKTFDKEAYAKYLAGQYLLFKELEALCSAQRTAAPLAAVYDEALHRTAPLARDLHVWWGSHWQQKAATPSPQTAAYLGRLRSDASDPWLLLCHHFLQYNAVLSGGQYLGSMVATKTPAAAPAGVEFYTFGPECLPTHARVQRYLDEMDKLPITPELRDRMLECMRAVYRLLLSMFDEAYTLAPVEGVSYADSKAQASPAVKSSIPPPPLDPVEKAFTAAQLLKHNGQSDHLPLLTSVLGRVYDVSVGKEFFGKGGPYEMFAGHDGTYNLAVMSLKKHTLDKFDYELDAEDKECLSDWIAYFDNRYGRPVGQLSDRKHAVSMKDLPRATKIPFSNSSEETTAPATVATSKL